MASETQDLAAPAEDNVSSETQDLAPPAEDNLSSENQDLTLEVITPSESTSASLDPALDLTTTTFNPQINSTAARKRPRSVEEEVEVLLSEVFGEVSPPQEASTLSEDVSPPQATAVSEVSTQVTSPQATLPLMSAKLTTRTDVSLTPPSPYLESVFQPSARNILPDLTLTSPPPPVPQATEPVKVRLRKNATSSWSSIDVSVKTLLD